MFNPLKGNAMSTTLDGFCHRMVRVGDVKSMQSSEAMDLLLFFSMASRRLGGRGAR
jgi:hypothetical protein